MSTTQNSLNANSLTPLSVSEGGTGLSSPTNHGIMISQGSSPMASQTLTNGQILIGNTGIAPSAAAITAGSNISITNGAGSITVTTVSAPNFSSIEVNNGSNNITIQPPASGLTNTVYTLPVSAPGVNGEVLSSNTSGVMSWVTNTASSGFTSINIQTFTSSGTYTPSSNLSFAIVEVIAGGAGGGGGSNNVFGGGGAGGYAKKVLSSSTIGSSQNITIGAGGGSNSSGGNSSFGSIITSTGGSTGIVTAGGAGGTASGGEINIPGGSGQYGFIGASGTATGGIGGNSQYGDGGYASQNNGSNGGPGTGYGAGGGGSWNSTAGTGAAGIIIITEYIS